MHIAPHRLRAPASCAFLDMTPRLQVVWVKKIFSKQFACKHMRFFSGPVLMIILVFPF